VHGALSNNVLIYLVVTNDSGDSTIPFPVGVGLLPYESLIAALSPDHYWALNNTYSDTGVTGPIRDMTNGVVGTWTFGSSIRDGNTHSLNMNNVTSRREISDSTNMNITISSKERTLSMWFMPNGIQSPLASIWKEGGGVQNLCFLSGYGNVIMFQLADVAGSRDNVQAWSNERMTAGVPIHVVGRYSHLDTIKESRLYINAVKQTNTDGNPMTIGIFDSHSGDVVWGDPDTNLETGGTDIAYNGPSDSQISDFITWSDNSAGTNAGGLTDAEILDLFRRGAPPKDTIVTGTESAMQTALDATTDARGEWPLDYRIEPVTGGGDFELVMNDKVFNDRTTLHLEYRGQDTLTIVNGVGSDFDSTKTFSATDGTIVQVNEVPLTITAKDFTTGALIVGARVRLLAAAGGPETLNTILLEGITDAQGELAGTYRFSTDQPVAGRMRRATTGTLYKTTKIAGTITANGFDSTLLMIQDQ
jgi:hypothetical protein